MIGNTLVIGFGHKARHGKDTAARYIHEAFPEETKIYSFANALKAYCRVAYGMRAKNAPLLQTVGVLFRDHVNSDIWKDILEAQIEEEQPKVALITDVRFPNEADFCDAPIKVTRIVTVEGPAWTHTWVPYVATDRPANHTSEIALDDYRGWHTEIIVPEGNLEKLRQDALAAYRSILEDARALAFVA